MSRGIIDDEKKIYLNPNDMQRRDNEKEEFALHEVYAVDVLVSSGESKPRETDIRTNVYKKADLITSNFIWSGKSFYIKTLRRCTCTTNEENCQQESQINEKQICPQ